MDKSDKLLILLVSDIHESIQNVEKLKQHCHDNNIIPDYIFCLGDIMTISNGHQEDESIYQGQLIAIKKIFEVLETICPKLIYLPGNHDHKNFFKVEQSPKITENSINLHLKSHFLKDDLLIIGIGGSICSFYSNEEFYPAYKDINTKNIEWLGYPYINDFNSPNYEKSDELFKKDLNCLNNYIDNHKGDIIMLTHNGPFTSNTSNQYENRNIYSGSMALNEFLLKHENKIIANVHGHTHEAQGMGKIHNIQIFNPGALIQSKIGILNLVKSNDNSKWNIQKYQQINLI